MNLYLAHHSGLVKGHTIIIIIIIRTYCSF